METKKKENQIKLLLLGDQAVGKSSLMTRYTEDEFLTNIMGTAGLDLKKKNIEIDGENIKIMIYDTAGHNRYRQIARSQYKGSQGIILVYDITDKKSFANVSYWMTSIYEVADSEVDILLVGNKIDKDKREVEYKEGEELALKFKVMFAETSAKSGENVESAFFKLITNIHNKIKNKESPPMKIEENGISKKKNKCGCVG